MNQPILVIEDDLSSARWVEIYLKRAGYSSVLARDGIEGLKLARKLNPSLVLLDLMLPGIDGMEICRILRKESDIPIIMLTARVSKRDRIKGLDGGADDYIVKPFDPDELIVRIKTLLRRYSGFFRTELTCGPLSLSKENHVITLYGNPLNLSKAQYSIMSVFMNHPNTVLTRNQLIEQAFDNDFESFERAVDSHIRRLRKLIHHRNYQPIRTVYGLGYKLECTDK